EEPVLLAELKPGRPQQHDWKSSCETWSVAFSPDGAWFAWSQGHCVVKLIPWPLEEAELSCKTLERKSGKAEARSRAGAKEKTLECGQIVWGLAFSSWPPAGPRTAGLPCLVLATGLNDGQIKVWEVQTGHLLFSLLGHQDVVRDLSFAPNGSLILVSASRDKTLRVWDLSRDGRQVQVLTGHVQWVYCCSISPDCRMLCSVAGEKSVSPRVWAVWSSHSSSLGPLRWVVPGAILMRRRSPGEKHQEASWGTLETSPGVQGPKGLVWAPMASTLAPNFLFRLLRIWALELRSPVAFAPMTNGLCCMYFPHLASPRRTRDGHVQFWSAPRALASLKHLCRRALRTFLTTYQVLALPIPRKLKEFLTYRSF
ncbi:WD repeat and SOCS box-containing protein 2, partial [Tinamus guttatus]